MRANRNCIFWILIASTAVRAGEQAATSRAETAAEALTPGIAAAAPAVPKADPRIEKMIKDMSWAPSTVKDDLHRWVAFEAVSEPRFSYHFGGRLSAGYQFRYFGIDVRAGFGSAEWRALGVKFDPTTTTTGFDSQIDPDSEVNRVRAADEGWTYFLFEPGISVSGSLFREWLPRLSEKARFGIGRGSFADQVRGMGYTATVFSFEASLFYQVKPQANWAITGSVALYTGVLLADRGAGNFQPRRLPLNWMTTSLGLAYWF